jgi:hypothetical protein
MPEHPNAVLVRDVFAAFRAGDIDVVRAAIGSDAVWHFPGRTGKLAGDHRGRDAILAFLTNVMGLTAGTFRLKLIDVVAGDANAVALFRGRAERDGRVLDNPTCLRMRIDHGRIVELWEFVWDLYDVDAFWA